MKSYERIFQVCRIITLPLVIIISFLLWYYVRKAQRCIQNARSGGLGTPFLKNFIMFLDKSRGPCCRKVGVRIPYSPPLDTPLGKRSINFLYEFDVVPSRRGGGRNNLWNPCRFFVLQAFRSSIVKPRSNNTAFCATLVALSLWHRLAAIVAACNISSTMQHHVGRGSKFMHLRCCIVWPNHSCLVMLHHPRNIARNFAPFSHTPTWVIIHTPECPEMKIPRMKTSYGQKSFAFRGAKEWNNLDSATKLAPFIHCFKSRLKATEVH